MARIGAPAPACLDRFSSAATFDGWRRDGEPEPPTVTSPAQSWLLTVGWKRRGRIAPEERPAFRPGRKHGARPNAPAARPAPLSAR